MQWIAIAIKNGVPFDVAWAMDETELLGYAVVFKNLELPEDQQFNFDTMRFGEG